jgi:DNA-directed RNA polymerase subunit L
MDDGTDGVATAQADHALMNLLSAMIARLEMVESACRATGMTIPNWTDELLEQRIVELAERIEEARDPRR